MPDLRLTKGVSHCKEPLRFVRRSRRPYRDLLAARIDVNALSLVLRRRDRTNEPRRRRVRHDFPTPRPSPHTVCWQRAKGAFRFENQHSDRHAPGGAKSAICVQRFDDSLYSAIHTTYRSWLRSSSMHAPRDPPLKVVSFVFQRLI